MLPGTKQTMNSHQESTSSRFSKYEGFFIIIINLDSHIFHLKIIAFLRKILFWVLFSISKTKYLEM